MDDFKIGTSVDRQCMHPSHNWSILHSARAQIERRIHVVSQNVPMDSQHSIKEMSCFAMQEAPPDFTHPCSHYAQTNTSGTMSEKSTDSVVVRIIRLH